MTLTEKEKQFLRELKELFEKYHAHISVATSTENAREINYSIYFWKAQRYIQIDKSLCRFLNPEGFIFP